jgi:hypothetical protein
MKVTEILARLNTLEKDQRRTRANTTFSPVIERCDKNAEALRLAQQIIDSAATEALLPSAPIVNVAVLDTGFNQPLDHELRTLACTRNHVCLTAAGGPCNGKPRNRFQ